jgi:hypothetical protein
LVPADEIVVEFWLNFVSGVAAWRQAGNSPKKTGVLRSFELVPRAGGCLVVTGGMAIVTRTGTRAGFKCTFERVYRVVAKRAA